MSHAMWNDPMRFDGLRSKAKAVLDEQASLPPEAKNTSLQEAWRLVLQIGEDNERLASALLTARTFANAVREYDFHEAARLLKEVGRIPTRGTHQQAEQAYVEAKNALEAANDRRYLSIPAKLEKDLELANARAEQFRSWNINLTKSEREAREEIGGLRAQMKILQEKLEGNVDDEEEYDEEEEGEDLEEKCATLEEELRIAKRSTAIRTRLWEDKIGNLIEQVVDQSGWKFAARKWEQRARQLGFKDSDAVE